jgi:hypothetical protein
VPKRVVIGAQVKQQPESPMPNCTVESIELGKVGRRVVAASFDGGDLSSDAGVLLLRRADERIGLTRAVARVLADSRRAASVTHGMGDLLRQRLYALCCGWEDVTDHIRCGTIWRCRRPSGALRRWLPGRPCAA